MKKPVNSHNCSSVTRMIQFFKSNISQSLFRYPIYFSYWPRTLVNSLLFSHFRFQGCASHLLGVPQNRIATKVKRVGGAFGGKEWKSMAVALPAVLAAKRLNRPVRIMLDRDEDMVLCGGRHPFYFKYKTAFDGTGKILAHDIVMYSNAGCTTDLSLEVRQTKCDESSVYSLILGAGKSNISLWEQLQHTQHTNQGLRLQN